MSKIVIKKAVSLDFLGEEYKDAVIVFRSIPLPEYDKIMDRLPKQSPEVVELSKKATEGNISDEEQARLTQLLTENGVDNKQSLKLIMDWLKEYFFSGKFPNSETGELEDLVKADLDGLDQEAAIRCFNVLTGKTDPKVTPN